MTKTVVIIGAGMGGLAASLRLARRGFRVRLFEASPKPGGLASSLEIDGFSFDGGPYILLDREGLEWAFDQLGLDLDRSITLRRIEEIYEVAFDDDQPVTIFSDLERTANGFEGCWKGSGKLYRDFVRRTSRVHARLRSALYSSPSPLALLRSGAILNLPFLMKSLGAVLRQSQLPAAIVQALGIWTHVAAQTLDQAPSPLAFVPALMHTTGAYYPVEGIGRIPRVLDDAARVVGVELHHARAIKKIRCASRRARGIETSDGEYIEADAVLSNASAIGTYLDLLDEAPPEAEQLRQLPLQSPGACAYLAVRSRSEDLYLRFRLPTSRVAGGEADDNWSRQSGNGSRSVSSSDVRGGVSDKETCRLLVTPSSMVPDQQHDGFWPARLIAPMPYSLAEQGRTAQQEFLDRLLAEDWWKQKVGAYKLLATRVPADWGAMHNLYRESMNPVMTARFMRKGRIAHRSPWVKGLYLAGSSTHPGQWVSFCAISGILAADKICEDFGVSVR